MSELILHHYDYSPFSEKIRLILGLKRLAWRSVTVPPVMPKPDLVPLTGGYRLTPVLQIGADVYCDTRLIAAEIDRRHPAPPLWSAGSEGFARAIEAWAERDLFWPIARYVSARNAQNLDAAFHADRAALRGKPPPHPEAIKQAAERSLAAIRIEVPRVADMLSDGRRFLLGEAPGLADFAVYHGLWFLTALPVDCSAAILRDRRIADWMARIAAIGHGRATPLDAKAALAIAAEARPASLAPSECDDTAPPIASRVAVRPEDATTAAVEGQLVALGRNTLALRIENPAVGAVVVHFPRLGYALKPIAGRPGARS
jgi:glutathione S-transferase